MDRLPELFEEEVLSRNGMFAIERHDKGMVSFVEYNKTQGRSFAFIRVSPYEIAGLALEAMGKVFVSIAYEANKSVWFMEYIDNNGEIAYLYDENYLNCIFKAVKEIWQD